MIRNRTPCRPGCGATGTGYGVDAGGSVENTSVRNGTIIGMGASAIRAGDDAYIREVRAIGNGSDAIYVGRRSIVRDCIVDRTGGLGIRVGSQGAVYDNTVRNAVGIGIVGAAGTTLSGNRVSGSGSSGILITGKHALLLGNIVENGAVEDVQMADGVVHANQFSENTSAVGCAVSPGVLITSNSIRSNTTIAINCGSEDGYSGNVFSGNGGSPQIVGPVEMNQNVCDDNTTCP